MTFSQGIYKGDTLPPPAPRGLCTDCGVSRMKLEKSCGIACQFIKPEYARTEERLHGRAALPLDQGGDEGFFGVSQAMYRARLRAPRPDAQWSGITTTLAEVMLESEEVDAVLCVIGDEADRWRPVPALITDPRKLALARGMRMGYAPLIAMLEEASARGMRRICLIGIPCQVYALRKIEEMLGMERIFVIGTPCSDNTSTENFHLFLHHLTDRPEEVTYLEFRTDFRVEMRFQDGTQRLIPFLKLPISELPDDFFPTTCKTCVDYTNRLADITVGYMAGDGDQWVIIRNERGRAMFDRLSAQLILRELHSSGKRQAAVRGFIENTKRAVGGLPLRRLPKPLRGLVGFLQRFLGPKGLEFARARLEMKAAETVLNLERERPAMMKNMVPDHVWDLVKPYGLERGEDR